MLPKDRIGESEVRQPESSNREKVEDMVGQSNLTHSQFLIWLGQSLAPDAPLYNMIQTFTFDTSLDVEVFQAAFQALIDCSDALRTIVEEVNGVPQQRVLESLVQKMEWIDMSGHPDPEGAYQAWLDKRRARMHDLQTCLFDTALIQLGPTRFVWYLNQHHLITDGWSFVLVYRRMAELYEGALQTGGVTQNKLPAYADYVQHERMFRETAAFARTEKYWADKMVAPPRPLTFYDAAPGKPTHRTERVVCDLGAERTAQLKAIATEKGIQTLNLELSLYNLFVTLFTAYLHRLGGNNSLILGSPFHNRPTPAFKETIGVFIEVCPLRLDVSEADTFITLHQKVMRETMNVLLNALPGTSRAEYNRAYEVLLNFVNVTFPPFAGTQPEVEWVHSGYGDRDHALRLQIHDFNATGSYKLHFDFNTHVFTAEQRAFAVQHFLRMLDAFLEDRDQPLHRVSLLTSAERTRFIEAFNLTAADYPAGQTIIQLFETQAARTPDAPALRLGEMRLTYSELNVRANQLAHHVRGMGIGAESLVAISMEHSLDMVIAILGVLKAGGAYVPIDPDYPPERAQVILEDLGLSPILLTQPHLREQFAGLTTRLLTLDDISISGETSMMNPPPAAAPGNLAYIIYTSGSTGKPKGVMIEHRSLVNYIWWAQRYNEYGPTEATVGCMIHRFDPKPIGCFCADRRPIHNAQIYILDKHLQPVPPGVIGEMCIGGAGVARGYLLRPELTEARFVPNPLEPGATLYRTGDLARWTPDGQMQFLGRADHQVKIKGYRIELGEIESILLEHPDVETAVVTVFQPEIPARPINRAACNAACPITIRAHFQFAAGVCNTCRDFDTLKDRFRDPTLKPLPICRSFLMMPGKPKRQIRLHGALQWRQRQQLHALPAGQRVGNAAAGIQPG
jgi:non-ribosomal peptide synthetase component F